MKKLDDYLQRYFKKAKLRQFAKSVEHNSSDLRKKQLEIAQIIYKTQEIMKNIYPENLYSQIKIRSYKNKNLYISVPNKLLAQELKFYESVLREELIKQKIEVNEIFYLIHKIDYIL